MFDYTVPKLEQDAATDQGDNATVPSVEGSAEASSDATKTVKPITTSKISAPASERHQWVQGNLSIDARCIVCSNLAGSEPTLKDHRCLWCQRTAHTTCLAAANATPCQLGPFPEIVVPSRCVVGSSSRPPGKQVKEPKFKVSELPENTKPLLCVVNPSSGAQDSPALLRGLYALVNPCQVADVSRDNPEALLRAFEPHLSRCRILACGGDGTIAWVFSILDKLIPANQPRPPVGVLPLGTGNDLARVMGWGGGWAGDEVKDIVKDICDAEEVELDRWNVVVEPRHRPQRKPSFVGRVVGVGEKKKKEKKTLVMNNYFSMGTDASVALEFHTARLQKPHYFKSRFVNKVFYALIGGKYQFSNILDFFGRAPEPEAPGAPTQEERKEHPSVDAPQTDSPVSATTPQTLPAPTHLQPRRPSGTPILQSVVHLNGQRTPLDLSTSSGALIVLNIASYGGGGMIYSPAESEGSPKSMQDDGKVEVMTVNSPLHLGASVVGLASPRVYGQAESVRIEVSAPAIAMQVDGEPWQQEGPCVVTISLFGRTKMLKRREESEEDEEEEEEEGIEEEDDPLTGGEEWDVGRFARMRQRRTKVEDEGVAIGGDEDEEVAGHGYWR
ncbi:hypothetical protein HDV00_008211 [Rhizophlyctis rosea]|nr:hypothetical protein HDV00_008211 [Rhizophlyctis rosea]